MSAVSFLAVAAVAFVHDGESHCHLVPSCEQLLPEDCHMSAAHVRMYLKQQLDVD